MVNVYLVEMYVIVALETSECFLVNLNLSCPLRFSVSVLFAGIAAGYKGLFDFDMSSAQNHLSFWTLGSLYGVSYFALL